MCANPSDTPTLDDRRRALVRCPRARAMAARIAHRFSNGRGPDDYEDYLGAAVSGLAEAAARFDFSLPLSAPTLEATYCGYAYVWALNAVVDLRRQEQAAPCHLQDYVARLLRQGSDPCEPGVTEGDERLACQIQMRPESVAHQRRHIAAGMARPCSSDAPPGGLAPSAEESAMASLRDRAVRNAVAGLSRELRPVLSLYLEGFTRVEIAEQMGLPERRVKAHLAEGFETLRERLADLRP